MRGDFWLFVTILVLIISLVLNQVALVLISVLFLLAGGISRLWNHFCLHRIEYRRTLSSNKVFFGDELTYELEIANRKLLPLPWVQIQDELPEQVTLLKGKTGGTLEDRVTLINMFPLNLYHRVKRRFPMRCQQRGCFVFGPTHIRSGDLFGFFRKDRLIENMEYLFVYPRLLPLDRLGIPSKQLFGDIRLKQHLFQDPVLTAGVREYQSGDSLKRIHWKSTARLGRLQTRVFEPTTTVDLAIFLDVRTTELRFFGSVVQLQELSIMAAAAIAQHGLNAGFRVGLYANQITRFSEGMLRVPHGRHPEQMMHILEALAQIHQVEAVDISKFVRQEVANLPWGSTLLVITARANEELVATLLDLKRVGRSVALVQVGSQAPEGDASGIPVYQVSDETAWEILEEINLVDKAAEDSSKP